MFYKKRMNWQSLISIHSGIQQYCDESKSQHIQLSQDKGKVMVDISHSITIVQKVLVLDTKAIFFHKNFLGTEGRPQEQTALTWHYSGPGVGKWQSGEISLQVVAAGARWSLATGSGPGHKWRGHKHKWKVREPFILQDRWPHLQSPS